MGRVVLCPRNLGGGYLEYLESGSRTSGRDRINVIARRKSGTVRGEEGGESVTFVPFLVCEERLSRVRGEVQLIDDS